MLNKMTYCNFLLLINCTLLILNNFWGKNPYNFAYKKYANCDIFIKDVVFFYQEVRVCMFKYKYIYIYMLEKSCICIKNCKVHVTFFKKSILQITYETKLKNTTYINTAFFPVILQVRWYAYENT